MTIQRALDGDGLVEVYSQLDFRSEGLRMTLEDWLLAMKKILVACSIRDCLLPGWSDGLDFL